MFEKLKRFLYGLGGAVLAGVGGWLADVPTFTWRNLGIVAMGAVAGFMGTGKKKEQ